MAYENLKSAIKQAIKQNGNQEITGSLLQSTLLNIVNTLGADYKFLGFASPSTVPPTSEEGNLFYFATIPGDYSNFKTNTGNLVITIENGVFFFTKNATDSYWNSNKVFEIVQAIGEAEDKVMSQKATSTAIEAVKNRAEAVEKAVIFDVSAYNNGAVFESLSALLSASNLSTLIPTEVRCGGMTIRFIQSSDNKYVQYRLMSTSFSTNGADWQGVDEQPTNGSDNLVKSGGVYNSTPTVANSSTESDLDISDEDGNVLVRCKNGHIQTKNFNSETSNQTSVVNGGNADLDISDEYGNVIARFSGGNFQTKNFNSTNLGGEQVVQPLAGKTVAFLGDSITAGIYGGSTAQTCYVKHFKDISGCIVINKGVGNASFSQVSGRPRIISQVDASLSNADVIVVFAGINDEFSNPEIGDYYKETVDSTTGDTLVLPPDNTTNFAGSIHQVIRTIRSYAVHKPIVFVTPLKKGIYQDNVNNNGSNRKVNGRMLKDYCDCMKDICAFYAVPVYDLNGMSNIDMCFDDAQKEWATDRLHPIDAANRRIAQLMYKFIINNTK